MFTNHWEGVWKHGKTHTRKSIESWLPVANLQSHTAPVTFTNQWECLAFNNTGSLIKVASVGHTGETFQDVRKRTFLTHINTHTLFYVTSNLLYLKLSASRTLSHINNSRFVSEPGKINPAALQGSWLA